MTAYTEQDFYDWLVEKRAPPAHPTFPTEQQLAKWRGRLPDLLLRWWQEQGWGSLSKGQYWVCDPDYLRPVLEQVFTGDPEYHVDDLIPFGYNALGMIDIFMGDEWIMTVDLMFGTVTSRGPSEKYPETDFIKIYGRINDGAHRLEWKDEDMIPLFPWALENLGELDPGEVYGFIPAYTYGGPYPVRNLHRLPVIEHLVMLAQLSPPMIYDYVKPADGEGGFGNLIPRRPAGPQP
ncbi:MAG: GAD-like domain-containing protein [Paracoccus sp. (in: a-proteobacteria)]|uniref:GAD-like domain-containing protein n=1 Tax=Paracoccus sp. TaxID=267 RepID=UPI0026E07253|nr:GAD-like domain-containing protein [Paracoccus sp. (in: a-proteobacteria)]MDO5623035.1 GAD-like domain-containing protein [Paracoccus sp. (in: a-proteobacteria)]